MIYLDSAATTLQKPAGVARAAKNAIRKLTSPGRSLHTAAVLASETAYACRETAARLFSVKNPENIVFTSHATHALNIAIKSIAKGGDRVVVSGYEHNAVTRPLHGLGVRMVVAGSDLFEPEQAKYAFEKRLTADTALVVCNHVSNVFGYIQPVYEIAALCRDKGIPFILDASQSAGCLEVNAEKLGAAFIAMPGHKGLYGPQGTGILICKDGAKPLIEGGTGSNSLIQTMPEEMPDRLEAGTHNMPGIAGLMSGMQFVEKQGIENILQHEKELIALVAEGLSKIKGIRVYTCPRQHCQSGAISFNLWGVPCEEVAEGLGLKEIAVRAGLHCSPLAHKSADTLERGTVRISVSAFNTRREIEKALIAIEDLAIRLRRESR